MATVLHGTTLAVVAPSRRSAIATLLAMAMPVPAARLNMATSLGMTMVAPAAFLAMATELAMAMVEYGSMFGYGNSTGYIIPTP